MSILKRREANTQDARTWRELLAIIIRDPQEKQRIAEELGVRPITLIRWINEDSRPRTPNIRRLVEVVPQHREQLLDLLSQEEIIIEPMGLASQDPSSIIPTEFYVKVLAALSTAAPQLRYWSLCNLILQQAIGQLDPDRLGMAIWVVRCMPPSGPSRKVRSLRESIGFGTPPWGGKLEHQGLFLGAESLAGNVVTLGRSSVIENLDEEYTLPASRVAFEKSAAVYPILYAGRVAGALLASSTQYNFFVSQARASLMQKYADLIALAFSPTEFYDQEDIGLFMMPTHDEQKQFFTPFRQRVADKMMEASRHGEPINAVAADLQVWQELEEELLDYMARRDERKFRR